MTLNLQLAARRLVRLASLFYAGFYFSIILAVAVGFAQFIYIAREIGFERFSDLLPEGVNLMSRGLRAGHSIQAVLKMVGNEIADPLRIEFRAQHIPFNFLRLIAFATPKLSL